MNVSACLPNIIIVHSSTEGIINISLPFFSHLPDTDHLIEIAGHMCAVHKGSHPMGEKLASEIKDYLMGTRFTFSNFPLYNQGSTDFQKMVWQTLTKIEYGEKRSYQWLAQQIGNPKAQRAVGRALNKNPWPIVLPCHRVIGKDGSYKHFSSGVFWKIFLLKLEEKQYKINNNLITSQRREAYKSSYSTSHKSIG
ncbi:MAG: methylated-DNA--[protein]-cysteine S-methyltransferase [bacterium]